LISLKLFTSQVQITAQAVSSTDNSFLATSLHNFVSLQILSIRQEDLDISRHWLIVRNLSI